MSLHSAVGQICKVDLSEGLAFYPESPHRAYSKLLKGVDQLWSASAKKIRAPTEIGRFFYVPNPKSSLTYWKQASEGQADRWLH